MHIPPHMKMYRKSDAPAVVSEKAGVWIEPNPAIAKENTRRLGLQSTGWPLRLALCTPAARKRWPTISLHTDAGRGKKKPADHPPIDGLAAIRRYALVLLTHFEGKARRPFKV